MMQHVVRMMNGSARLRDTACKGEWVQDVTLWEISERLWFDFAINIDLCCKV